MTVATPSGPVPARRSVIVAAARWPDLAVTTDHRSVLWDIVASRFEVVPATVFPQAGTVTPGPSLDFMTIL